MRIARAKDSHQSRPFLKIALMGLSGAGKSSWAGRSPRPLIILTEPHSVGTIQRANPDAMVVVVETWEDFRTVFAAIKTAAVVSIDGQPGLETTILGEKFVFQTAVFDSFTDLQRMAINRLAGVEAGTRDRLDLDAGAINLSIEKWGQLTQGCEDIWSQQRALACNTVFLFLADERVDADQNKTTVPMLSGAKLPFLMGQYFNAVGLAMVRNTGAGTQHIIRWKAANTPCKPFGNWPNVMLVTETPGQTTLGSLLLYSNPGLSVAHEPADSADFVQPPAAAQPAAPAGIEATETAKAAAEPAKEPARRRRG